MDAQYDGWARSVGQKDMEPQQEGHLASIKGEFLRALDVKYRKGQAAHGGDMPFKPGMFAMLYEELIDGLVYYLTSRAQLRHAYRRLGELTARARIEARPYGRVDKVLEILNEIEQVGLHIESIVEGDE